MHPRLLLLVSLTFAAAATAAMAAAPRSETLDLDPDHLPWRLESVFAYDPPPDGQTLHAAGLGDVDGDGRPELLVAEPAQIMAFEVDGGRIKPRWQHNLAEGWRHNPGAVRLAGGLDLDRDGIQEIPYTAVSADRGAWRYQVFDPETGGLLADAPLPVFPGPHREPWWDGYYHVAGVLDDPRGDGRPAVLLVREVMYDARPRGLVAVDAADGSILWEWLCGPNPLLGHTAVTDLDGDGRQEIVLYGGAPGNLGGELVNGTSDDRARLFVVSDRGETLVDRVLGPERFAGALQVADLDGDGRMEIVTYSCSGNPGVTNVLAVWDGPTGEIRAQVRGVPGYVGLSVLPGPDAGTSWLVAGADDGTVRRLLFAGDSLVEDLRRTTAADRCAVLAACDVLGDEAREIVVDVGDGARVAVLDRELRPLAVSGLGTGRTLVAAWPWHQAGSRFLLAFTDREWALLQPLRRSLWDRYGDGALKPGLAGAVLLLAFAGGLGLGRRRRRSRPRPLSGQPDRHRLRTVLQDLQEVGHGSLGVTRGLHRVVMLAASEAGLADPVVRTRFDEVRGEVSASVLDRLRGIAAAAAEAGFAPVVTAAAAAAVDRFAAALEAVAGSPAPTVNQLRTLRHEQEQVEAGFVQLRRETAAYFTTDCGRMLRGMLLVRETDLGRAGVTARLDAPEVARVLMDATDLRFVLDNLLDNAVRAMAAAERRELTIAVVAGAEVVITVADSGPGIPPEREGDVFSGRPDGRRGGGLGLARSRDLLARWRGAIALARRPDIAGAVFTITIPAAPEH